MKPATVEEMAVDHSEFAVLLRQVARRVTRRGALAALAGSALLSRGAPGSEATKKARRRKARRRKSSSDFLSLRPIYIWVQNPGPNPVTLAHGDARWCCNVINRSVTVPSLSRVAVASGYNDNSDYTQGFVWINERYWISFNNRPLERPDLTAALDGEPATFWCCLPTPPGTTVVNGRPMSVGDLTNFRLADHSFSVRREKDTNYIVFTVILPATL